MKILMVNKFLHLNGGSETYVFQLGEHLKTQGHSVEYFGMEHAKRIVGNRVGSYTANMDFHSSKLQKLTIPFHILYSAEARQKIRLVLDDFHPDVVHLNNFNFQLTPSILYEIKKYEKEAKQKVRIIYTAHDYQLVCPNHRMNRPGTGKNCEKCLGGHFYHCMKGKCIHGSTLKSALGMLEGYLYQVLHTYRHIDTIICPSRFLTDKMNTNPMFAQKTITLSNFIEEENWEENREEIKKEDYVLYFGRFSEEKGIRTLIKACRQLPQVPFVFAGKGPLEKDMEGVPNIKNMGFLTGEPLKKLIQKARFSIYPSEWYENCPFSVMESQQYETPVLGACIGGIPELIENGVTGELFQSGDAAELTKKIQNLWDDREKIKQYRKNCRSVRFDTIFHYTEKLMKIYKGLEERK